MSKSTQIVQSNNLDVEVPFDVPTTPWVPPHLRVKKAPLASVRQLEALAEVVLVWHTQLQSDAVDGAADDLREGIDAAIAAVQHLQRVDADERAEVAGRTEAARNGTEAPQATDWPVERGERRRAYDEAYAAAVRAQARYSATVADEAPRRVAELRVRAAKQRARALQALRKVEADVRAAGDASAALVQFGKEQKILRGERGLWQSALTPVPAGLGDRVRELVELIEAVDADPITSGDYLDAPQPQSVPAVTRAALWERAHDSERAGSQLMAIEAAEESVGKRESHYTAAQWPVADLPRILARIADGHLPL